MDFEERVREHFARSMEAQQQTLAREMGAIVEAAALLAQTLRDGGKVLCCGNGGSAADAQHFAAELSGRFERERPGLAGLSLTTDTSALTAIGNDYGFERVFARQVEALGRPGDLLLAISTSGNSPNVLHAVRGAQRLGLRVLAMTGRDGGEIARTLRPADLELRAASTRTARVQEVHILMLHCLCDLIDEMLAGG